MHALSKYISIGIVGLFIALPNTTQTNPTVTDEYTSDQKPSSNFRSHIKDIAEVITAIGSGATSTAATALFLKESIQYLIRNDYNEKSLIPAGILGLSLYYCIQKMPKCIMKSLLGRNYNMWSYNTIMLLASSNLLLFTAVYLHL